ncbi:hypothetical protein [Ruegeria meonggei]|uniref:hypothetical protein n=1 Tax=Ruegeria meonggei TaxID=1446476 RepID=UPI00367026FC
MITNEQMMEAIELPNVAELSFEAFSQDDLINLIMQRSEILHDQPRSGRIIRAWSSGNAGPAKFLVEKHGTELARRAAAIIYLEYQEIRDTIDTIAPSSVADIGCGYAMFDLFLWKDHRCDLTLIDLETSDKRHFGYEETGAAYSNLAVAHSFLTENGVSHNKITCLNPERDELPPAAKFDLAMSFISCGFHYPVQTYADFFRNAVSEDGTIILDLRSRLVRAGTEFLETIGTVSHLVDAAKGSAKRVSVRKNLQAQAN